MKLTKKQKEIIQLAKTLKHHLHRADDLALALDLLFNGHQFVIYTGHEEPYNGAFIQSKTLPVQELWLTKED
jgi:hypothetical protein